MRALVAAAIVAGLTTAAQAADGAQSRAIGYSLDRKYFAFEQYGIQDGSGFSYSEIYVLDINADSWTAGTPVRIVEEDENSTLSTARAKALRAAQPVIDKFKIEESVDVLAYNPFTEIVPNRKRVLFDRYYNSMGSYSDPQNLGAYELKISNIPLPQPAECGDADEPSVGLELVLRNTKSGTAKTVRKDAAIPKSRYCPISYDIEAVFAASGYGTGPDPLVALIGVYARGFEGSNRRFIAIPFELIE